MTANARADNIDGRQFGFAGRGGSMLAPVVGGEAPVTSPAHRLQDSLEREFSEPSTRKWPPIVGVGFVVATGGLFWSAAALALSAL
jgi:hypothetical protein